MRHACFTLFFFVFDKKNTYTCFISFLLNMLKFHLTRTKVEFDLTVWFLQYMKINLYLRYPNSWKIESNICKKNISKALINLVYNFLKLTTIFFAKQVGIIFFTCAIWQNKTKYTNWVNKIKFGEHLPVNTRGKRIQFL